MSINPEHGSGEPGAKAASALEVGDRFPVESLARSGAALTGPSVVYFYPKDGTSTCTREAAAFQRALPQYQEAGVEIIGVSTDDTESHRCFARDEGIGFHLVSDPDASLTSGVGALKDYGEYGELAARVTFLLDDEGTVRQRYDVDDDVTSHPGEVLSDARRLGLVPGGGGAGDHAGGAPS
jgi:thioredoxin-dependent peroxiredoxin